MLIAIKTDFVIKFISILVIFCGNKVFCDNLSKRLSGSIKAVDVRRTKVWGPGLRPDEIVLPVRYFFIQAVDGHGFNFNQSVPYNFTVDIVDKTTRHPCPFRVEQIDRGDGSYIVRYRVTRSCRNVAINVRYKDEHVALSPYNVGGPVYSEKCNCPELNLTKWLKTFECEERVQQIEDDLKPFKSVNFTAIRSKLLDKFDHPGSISLCNYVIKSNRVYRKCHGQHTGFKMFADSILSALTRRVQLPDIEFFVNLGDWPLMKKGGVSRTHGPYPIFSWCGSDDTFDIVMPSYDLTEATLEAMHRVTLDILSVQKSKRLWHLKEQKAFWRGRDSRRERLDLVDIARRNQHLFNVSLTNFFFFRDEEAKYGPKVPHMSFFDFFDYKYQINIDGTVAAYRLPYLLAGDSVVFKQDSPFYEHFYGQLEPMEHFIPIKRDLTDLVDQIKWAQRNDAKAKKIAKSARDFVNENLLPTNIFCYHVKLFQLWQKSLVSDVRIANDMEEYKLNTIESIDCPCGHDTTLPKDEL